MPYFHSQRSLEREYLDGGWNSPLPAQVEASDVAIDPLTGLQSLEEFYKLGQPIAAACLAEGGNCAMAIVDIDHFRRLGDTHGEEAAGDVLNAVAAAMRDAAGGGSHLLARLGDEEFGVLLIGLGLDEATALCEDLRLAIAAKRMSAGELEFSFTVSVGLAEICGSETFDNYLNAADQFLFMAKCNGRNQVFSDRTVILQAAD